MVANINHKALLKKLKKQVQVLQRKEEKSRNKLKLALQKIRKLGRTQKTRLASKVRMMKGKMAEAKALTYAKIAKDLERQMMKSIEAKGKALQTAIGKLEKKHVAQLKKSITKRGKTTKKVKASRSGVKKALKGVRKQKQRRVPGRRKGRSSKRK